MHNQATDPHGEPSPTAWKDELREQWERDIKDEIEFLRGDIGLLSEIALTFNDETVRQLATYLMWCEMEMLQELHLYELPEWLICQG